MYRSPISAHSCVHSTHRAWLIGVRLALKASLALLLILLSGQQAHAALGARPQAFPPKLIVGVLAGGWSPFEMFQEGRFTGLSVDYLRAVVGPDVEITTKSFPDLNQLLAAACANRVDVLLSIARTPEREHCLSFSVPYFRGSTSVVTRASNALALSGEAQVQSARVAIERGFALGAVLRERFPRARIDSFADTLAALRAIKRGEDDAYFGFTPAVRHYLADPEFRDLSIAFEETGQVSEMRFAVPAGKSDLRDRLDRGLSALRPDDEAAIRARWIGGTFESPPASAVSNLVLSREEQAWLRSLPPLSVGFDADWAPFSTLDDLGRPSGIAADYLDYLGRTLGLSFHRAPAKDWTATIADFNRGNIALLATATRNDPQLKHATFTHAYETYPLVIVAREAEPAARGLNDFAERRIVVSMHSQGALRFELYGVVATVAPNLDTALKLLASGGADALVGNVAEIDAALTREYAGVLKVVGVVREPDPVGFAVRDDLAPLAGLIDRALLAMPASERQRIRQKWVTGDAPPQGGWSVTALRLLPVLIGIGVVLLLTLRAYVLLQREVSRRERTERELESQLNFQQTMMEMVPYPLVAKDLQGRYIGVNRAYEQATGLRREAVIGRTSADVHAWGEDNSLRLEQLTREALQSGSATQIELEFEDSQYDSRHGLFCVCVCNGVDGTPLCVLGTLVDITDIRRAEMLASETQRRLVDVTSSLPAVVFQLRRGLDGQYTFPYVGGDTKQLLGYDSAVLMRRATLNFAAICADDRPGVVAALERSAEMSEPLHLEFRIDGPGEQRWVRAELVPRREQSDATVWSGYWVDASTERLRADELARARDLAEAASRAKDDFLAMMSHEIRTPMNGVLGLVEVLERTRLDADQGEMLGMIHESAGALLQILDDLLDYSKIEAGRLTIESEPIDLRDLVDTAVGLLAGRAHEKGLKVRVDIDPQVAATLRGDSVRLRQILFNLLGNAIKFTPRGEVDVNVKVVEEGEAGQTVEMTVVDTGIGIAPEVQVRLFEPFVQAESSTTRRFGGTGLGLTICRKLIALMGGTLSLSSTPGKGTHMTLRLRMPLEMRQYTAGGLRGKRGVVATPDACVARALAHFGAALGIDLRCAGADLAELRDLRALRGVDLVFVGDGVELPAAVAQSGAKIVSLTEKPKPTGYRIVDNAVRVSINPISWRGLSAACAAALTGLSPTPARHPGAADAATAPPDRERAIASGRLVLVAEDHPVNQELIRHQLALLGFACDVVNDGAEAVEALDATPYGFLITDCHMPVMSGYELARSVRESEQLTGAHLPILGITANTAPEDLKACRDAGMDDCLVKPTRLATLREYLSRWFGADSARPASQGDATAAVVADAEPANVNSIAFVPVDLSQLTQIWGSESTVKSLLDAFVSAVRDDLRALPPLLNDLDVPALRQWHHRVAGAVGVLQYPPLLGALEQYRRQLTSASSDTLRNEGIALVRTCNMMLDGIEEQAALLA
ncbi:ATP-binding protein [Paraburkholderia terrae]|uniref:ATP-binding protein n=1 Tax=Paraburkholderia terrae TaxID=311230 RepID=UPI00296B00EA|nr:transporter substrate-binding domain-containing protein [Paraburkholderia terrae]MDW3656880.1 transporter substrate-binding domain-containing protein [Paraburkholderia terrae]